ncbi:MAG: hypothetical protein R3C59_06580 [Planctomycetaceae bacterium]
MEWQQDAIERMQRYAADRQIGLIERLGQGYDGVVVSTSNATALKSFAFERLFARELEVYQRLQEHRIDDVHGFAVPGLVDFDTGLWVLEMEIVSPPFVLDFAGAYLDRAPDYPPEVMEEWEADKCEQFGDERWETVRIVMFAFQRMGIYLADVKPGNIMFLD